jgi:3-methylcrotonyl-CoA carboxylase beta subunit
MGAEQLNSVLETVGSKHSGASLVQRIDKESEATFGSARLWDDGIIRPQDTRHYLGQALELRASARSSQIAYDASTKARKHGFGIWRM